MILRINHKGCASYGYQALAPLHGKRYLSRFFASAKHGGPDRALKLARKAERQLLRQARALTAGVV